LRDHRPIASKLECGALHRRAHLGLVKCFRVDFLVESFGDRGALKNAVLPEEEPVLERELSEREADDEALPGEEWPV
jgi:hypothetical protein